MDALKRREKIIAENVFEPGLKSKPGLKSNPGLALIGLRTTGPWAMEDVFDVLVPFIFIAAAEPFVIFVGYNFLIADQNLSGEEALSCIRS